MILIISDVEDIQIYWVIHYLKKLGASYALFNVREYPLAAVHTAALSDRFDRQTLRTATGERIHCADVRSVWYRKPDEPHISTQLPEAERDYGAHECRQALRGLYESLSDRYWISPLPAIQRADTKPRQLRLARSLGLSIPDTLITNDPDEAYRFYVDHPSVVYKTLSDGLIVSRALPPEDPVVHGEIYTTPLAGYSRHDFEPVRNCPCLFQAYVPKAFELRVTTVRDRVFAAEIHSQEHPATKHDWRQPALSEVTHRVHEMPESIGAACVALVERLGLQFGAIDMIYTPAGDYVFLEINPNGQYGWIEDRTGMCISGAIAEALHDGRAAAPRTAARSCEVQRS